MIFVAYFFLLFSYFFSLLIFGKVVLPSYEHLTIWPVHYKIFSNFYFEGKSAFDIFLGGNIKWHYFPQLFQPLTFLSIIVDIKSFTFIYDIIEKSLAFYASFILSKKISNNEKFSAIVALFYATIVNLKVIYIMPGSGFCFAPYLFYLLLKAKPLKIKHYFIFFLAGLSISPISEFGIFLIFFLAYLINQKIVHKNFINSFYFFTTGVVVLLIPLFYSIYTEELHRIDHIFAVDHIYAIEKLEILKIGAGNLASLFHIPKYIIFALVLLAGIFSLNKNLIYIYLNTILVIFLIIFSDQIKFVLGLINNIFYSFNLIRIENLIPFLIILILIYLKNDKSKINLNKFLIALTFISSILIQISIPTAALMSNIKKSLNDQKRISIEKIMYGTDSTLSIKRNFIKIKEVTKILINKNNYDEKIDFFNTNKSFDDYYRYDEYKKIKEIVENSRVASIGIDPMIAAMNGIKVIDGYHNLYPKSYKNKFKNIINDELKMNESLEYYFNNWGNQLYLFYNDPKNLKINFKNIKKLDANYLISSFEIKDKDLLLKKKVNDLFLYFII